MLDEDDAQTSQTIGTLIGVGSVGRGFAEVFSAFKKGIEEQVDEGDADTHYDLAIAYKEMGLNEDAVRELEAVLRTGTRTIEALSLLAHCKLALGDPDVGGVAPRGRARARGRLRRRPPSRCATTWARRCSPRAATPRRARPSQKVGRGRSEIPRRRGAHLEVWLSAQSLRERGNAWST